jgi:hypothetical protein
LKVCEIELLELTEAEALGKIVSLNPRRVGDLDASEDTEDVFEFDAVVVTVCEPFMVAVLSCEGVHDRD